MAEVSARLLGLPRAELIRIFEPETIGLDARTTNRDPECDDHNFFPSRIVLDFRGRGAWPGGMDSLLLGAYGFVEEYGRDENVMRNLLSEIGKSMRRRAVSGPVFALVALIATVALCGVEAVAADAESKGIERQTEHHGARASCDSKVLPEAGFVIVKEVPGKEGECYWKRITESEAKPEEHLSPEEAKRYRQKLEHVRKQKMALANSEFQREMAELSRKYLRSVQAQIQDVNECGTDVSCMRRAMAKFDKSAIDYSFQRRAETEYYDRLKEWIDNTHEIEELNRYDKDIRIIFPDLAERKVFGGTK